MTVLGTPDENILFKFYLDPVVTNPGVVVPSTNLNTGSLDTSVAVLTSKPIVTSNGKLLDLFNLDQGEDSTAQIVLAPGHSLFVTERANAENTRAAAVLYWQDCKIKLEREPRER
jgi:hypothetical protein